MICPKCQHQRTESDDPAIPDYQCPACGIIYAKFGKPPTFTIKKQSSLMKSSKQFLDQPLNQAFSGLGSLADKYVDWVRDKPATPRLRKMEAQFDKIASEMGDDRFFTKKELNYLPEIMSDDEDLLAFSSGYMEGNTWLIALTDRRILFIDKGIIFGVKQASIELDKVNAVSGTTGIIFGKIVIQDGATSRVITNVLKRTVVPFTNKVRDAINARKHSNVHTTSISDVEKLEKLATLLDKGLITREDFDKQKSILLNTDL